MNNSAHQILQDNIASYPQDQKGFMKILHSVMEKKYGPDSPLPDVSKVFEFILHDTIRWHRTEAEYSTQKISKATGVSSSAVRRSLKSLEASKQIKITRRKSGNICLDNIIGLHPDTYGEVVHKNLRIVQPPTEPDDTPPTSPGGHPPSKKEHTKTENPLPQRQPENLKNNVLKNKSKEQDKDNVEGIGIPWERAREGLLSKYPGDAKRLDSCFRHITDTGMHKNIQVKRPAGFMLKGWQWIRFDFAFVDDVERVKSRKIEVEEPIDQAKADRARDLALAAFRNKSMK